MSSTTTSSSEPELTASRRLRLKIGWVHPAAPPLADGGVDAAAMRQAYVDYLCVLHGVIRASVPLMEAAYACAAQRGSDPVAAALADYLAHHIAEERHHDEWMLDDLAALGVGRAAVLDRMPGPAVATLVGSQYYWILHYHPIAILGYIAVLEGTPPDVASLEALAERLGLPLAAFSTLLRHAGLDPRHRADLDALIDRLPLSLAHHALLGVSALHTVRWLGEALRPCVRVF